MAFSFVQGFKKQLDSRIDAMMTQMGQAGVEEARRLVPVLSGQLRDSIGYVYRQSDKTLQLYADMPYALAIEFGSRTHRAQPFLRPALLSLRNFKLSAVNVELGFQAKSSAKGPPAFAEGYTARANEKTNAKLNRGVVRRARVKVRRYDPHRPLS
jgi:hypothetical protein